MAYEKLIDLYGDRKNEFEGRIVVAQRKSNDLSWLRVGLMLSGLLVSYFAISEYAFLFIPAAILLIGYVVAMIHHDRLKEELRILRNLVRINEWEIRALAGDHSMFDGGEGFIDHQHPFATDLDLFGEGSVYQLFNRTCTEQGGEKLAGFLAHPMTSVPEISSRQESVKELGAKLEFRQYFHAIGMASAEKKQDQQKVLEWLKLPSHFYGKSGYRVLLKSMPIVSALTLIFWIMTGSYVLFMTVTLVQWAIIGSHTKYTSLFQDYVGNRRELLEKFMAHFKLLSKEKFTSAENIDLASRCDEAHRETQRLVARVKALDLRLNLLATILLNSTILYDLQCIYRLEEWREKNRHHLRAWLESIGKADALNSFGAFVFNHPEFVWPRFNHELRLDAQALGHPLIERKDRVDNSVVMTARSNVWLVTGANMAGKSTFLRTVGVNVVLALSGSVVCARMMDCPVIEVFTGMRNTDSIQDHQSYFYAELLRLQRLIGRLNDGRRVLVLLDEILRGTNSTDKLTGSEELIGQLIRYPCLAIIATHDVALGALESRYDQVANYHFETSIANDELHFDYLLKPGVSQGKNATFLMRKMGIIGSS